MPVARYLIYVRPVQCLHCNAVSHEKYVMEVSTFEKGKDTVTRVNEIRFAVPIATSHLPPHKIPVCDLCFREFSTATLPLPLDEREFSRTVEEKNRKNEKPSLSPSPQPSAAAKQKPLAVDEDIEL